MKRRAAATLVAAVCSLSALTGCGGDSEPASNEDLEPVTIDITISGDTVDPNGERIEVSVDEPINLVVNAEKAGELHVHSEPEQELSYGAGETKLELVLDKPGVVEVEDHELEKVIVQLQVTD